VTEIFEHPAIRLLDLLDRSGHPFVVLHREEEVAAGIVSSDVDITVGGNSSAITHDLLVLTHRAAPDLHCVGVWGYDNGATASFWTTADGGRVQLDITGAEATGKYGFRSTAFLAAAVQGRRWLRLNPDDAVLYELRKRQVKRDSARFELALRVAEASPAAGHRIPAAFTPGAARALSHSLSRGAIGWRRTRRPWRNLARLSRRIGRPPGTWVHVDCSSSNASHGEAAALALSICSLLERLVIRVRGPIEVSHTWDPSSYIRYVAPLRWRPGLIVTFGERPRGPKPDVALPSSSAIGDVLEALHTHTARQCERKEARRSPVSTARGVEM